MTDSQAKMFASYANIVDIVCAMQASRMHWMSLERLELRNRSDSHSMNDMPSKLEAVTNICEGEEEELSNFIFRSTVRFHTMANEFFKDKIRAKHTEAILTFIKLEGKVTVIRAEAARMEEARVDRSDEKVDVSKVALNLLKEVKAAQFRKIEEGIEEYNSED